MIISHWTQNKQSSKFVMSGLHSCSFAEQSTKRTTKLSFN